MLVYDKLLAAFEDARPLLNEAERLAGPGLIGMETVDAYDAEVVRLLVENGIAFDEPA